MGAHPAELLGVDTQWELSSHKKLTGGFEFADEPIQESVSYGEWDAVGEGMSAFLLWMEIVGRTQVREGKENTYLVEILRLSSLNQGELSGAA